MKNLIRKILKESSEKQSYYSKLNNLKNYVFNYLDKNKDIKDEIEDDPLEGIEYLKNYFGIEYTAASFIIFSHIVNNLDEDPLDFEHFGDWIYKSPNVKDFLISSNFYPKYFYEMYNDFRDIEYVDGKIILKVDDWSEFKNWFDDHYIARNMLSLEQQEFFDVSSRNVDLDVIIETLNKESIKIVTTRIVDEYQGQTIHGLDHREEFEHMLDEDGIINIDKNRNNITSITDPELLTIFLEESDLDGSDIVIDLYRFFDDAHNIITRDEIFNGLRSQIEDFLGVKGKWDETITFDITNQIDSIMFKFIDEVWEWPDDSYFIGVITTYFYYKHSGERLKTPDLDYYEPNYHQVIRFFNELIKDSY